MYERIARYYDLIHQPLTVDVGYVLTLAAKKGGPILELGCGTGRLLLPLARAGYTVTGVDNSPAMLAIARQRLAQEPAAVQARVTLVETDMLTLKLAQGNGRYPLAILPYNTALHIPPASLTPTLKAIAAYLPTGGTLFIDLPNPADIAQTPNDRLLTLENRFTDPTTGEVVVQMASSWLAENEQTLHITWLYDATPPEGGPIHRTVAHAEFYYPYPHELDLALSEAGYRLQALYGDYQQTPFDEESERLLVLAQKG